MSEGESLSSDEVMKENQALFGLRQKDLGRQQHLGKLDDLGPRQIACVVSVALPCLPACDILNLGGELEPHLNQCSPEDLLKSQNGSLYSCSQVFHYSSVI